MIEQLMPYWAIRHKPTGKFLPNPKGRAGRGGSHTEPTSAGAARPRLFESPIGARNALAQWLRGKHVCSRGELSDGAGTYETYEDTEVIHVPSRIKADMEIVSIGLTYDPT